MRLSSPFIPPTPLLLHFHTQRWTELSFEQTCWLCVAWSLPSRQVGECWEPPTLLTPVLGWRYVINVLGVCAFSCVFIF